MDVISLRLSSGARLASARLQRCRVAGLYLEVGPALDALIPFEVEEAEWPARHRALEPGPGLETGRLLYDGDGWLGERQRAVHCSWTRDGYRLDIEGAGRFRVAADGAVTSLRLEPDLPERLLTEVALGPALILALGLHGVFCLHAAALGRGDGAVALLGASGSGKSTLAAGLGRASKGGGSDRWRRLADDVLPVPDIPGPPLVRPQFPQLKLDPGGQGARQHDQQTPLAAIVVVEPAAPDEEPALEPLPEVAGTLALVRHTVAARLFAPDLLARHLSFCTGLAGRVPILGLRYPHHPRSIAEIGPLLEAAIDGGVSS